MPTRTGFEALRARLIHSMPSPKLLLHPGFGEIFEIWELCICKIRVKFGPFLARCPVKSGNSSSPIYKGNNMSQSGEIWNDLAGFASGNLHELFLRVVQHGKKTHENSWRGQKVSETWMMKEISETCQGTWQNYFGKVENQLIQVMLGSSRMRTFKWYYRAWCPPLAYPCAV